MRFFSRKSGPPDAGAVMSRVIILKYQIVTGMTTTPLLLSGLMRSADDQDRQQVLELWREQRAQSEEKLRQSGLWKEMTSAERKFLRADPKSMTHQMLADASWLMESAECLLWALGYVESLPPYDTQAPVDDLNALPDASLADLIRDAGLRDPQIIARARDGAERWHWRSRTRQLQERKTAVKLPEGMTLEGIVALSADDAASEGLFAAPIDGDFPAFGRAYRDLTDDEFAQATSIAMERHRALNWLCGYAPGNQWDRTRTDT